MRDLGSGRWMFLAASGRAAAESYALHCGVNLCAVLTKDDLMRRPQRIPGLVREAGVDAVAVHSRSWRRQRNPQLYELALLLMPLGERLIVDEENGLVRHVSRLGLAGRIAAMPAQTLTNALTVGMEAARQARRVRPLDERRRRTSGSSSSILAVWPGSPDAFGGSLTHIAGIARGFQQRGFRVGVLTCHPPPDRLRAIVDDIELMPPLPAANRLTRDIEQISVNAALRRAGMALAQRLEPAFVYQRHSPFLVAGIDVARSLGVPFVLEWNGSEAWKRKNWQTQLAVERVFDPLVVSMERTAVTDATVIISVSEEAANMAVRVGADPRKTFVVPNGVDFDEVEANLGDAQAAPHNSSAVLGWVGTFGPWHGAEIAIRALALLPAEVTLLMVGDGSGREACQALAKSLGVSQRIEMTGALAHGNALRRLARCDVLLSPHTPLPGEPFFGSPTKIFEYMALGKPIVASRLGQIGTLLEEGVTARLVTPGNVDELAEAVREILASPDRGHAIGNAARREVARNHTWEQRAGMILGRLALATCGASSSSDTAGI